MRSLLDTKSSPQAWLSVTLDQSAYTAGDVVRGRVTLTVSEDLLGDELVVRIRGQERVSWVEEVAMHSKKGGARSQHKTHARKNAFLLDRLRLFAFPRALAKGEQYEFPFAYQTHASLPGVFTLDQQARAKRTNVRDLRASISYSVRATLDRGYLLDCWNAHARCDLVLHGLAQSGAPYPLSASAGMYDATSQSVRLLSLFDQGKCEIAASLDQPAYAPGDTARLQYHVQNASRVDIRALTVTLFHDVFLRLDHRELEPIATRVASFEFAGIPHESETSACVHIALVHSCDGRQLAPPTSGSLVKSGYRVHLQCDIPWSPDVVLDLPIRIAPRTAAPTTIPVAVPVPNAIPVDAPVSAPTAVQSEREAALASGIH